MRPPWSQTRATETGHQVSHGYILLLRRQNTKSHHLSRLTNDKTPSTTMIQSFFRVCYTTFPPVSPQPARRSRFECRVGPLSLFLSKPGTTFDLDNLALADQSISLGLFFLLRCHFFVRLARFQRLISPPEGFLGTLCSHIGLAVPLGVLPFIHLSPFAPVHPSAYRQSHCPAPLTTSLCIRYSSGHSLVPNGKKVRQKKRIPRTLSPRPSPDTPLRLSLAA